MRLGLFHIQWHQLHRIAEELDRYPKAVAVEILNEGIDRLHSEMFGEVSK